MREALGLWLTMTMVLPSRLSASASSTAASESESRLTGLVEQHERRVVQEDACEADALSFASREEVPSSPTGVSMPWSRRVMSAVSAALSSASSSSASVASGRAMSRLSRMVPVNRCVSWVMKPSRSRAGSRC